MPLCIFNFNRASYLTDDVTRHHHRRISSWVKWLRMLRATTSLLKQPSAFFVFLQRFSPEWPIRACSMITAVQFAMHWWWKQELSKRLQYVVCIVFFGRNFHYNSPNTKPKVINVGDMAYYVPPLWKSGGHAPRVPHHIAPMCSPIACRCLTVEVLS